jgi:CRISPR-associated protein Cmr2
MKELLLFQLGSVQEFISQARSTRDLWSGSYLLSWLMAHAIAAITGKYGLRDDDVVMPSLANNPLVLALRDLQADVAPAKVLVPNLPNRLLAAVPENKGLEAGELAKQAVRGELSRIGAAVWQWLRDKAGAKDGWRAAFDAQLAAFPQMAFATVPWDGRDSTWKASHDALEANLAARRNVRDFAQWSGSPFQKDSFSGKEEAIGDNAFWNRLRQNTLFNKAKNHRYGAVNLVKRLWLRIPAEGEWRQGNYLADALNFPARNVRGELIVASTQKLAGQNKTGSPYFAVLAFDGDRMGEKISGQSDFAGGIQSVSHALSGFAFDRVPGIVKEHDGFLVYAGGDDVLALLPSTRAIDCARAIETAFEEAGHAQGFTGSCGIAVGHKEAPLQMLVQKARDMEHAAKEKHGRNALALALVKRSGEIVEWGCNWDSSARELDLMATVTKFTAEEKLSARFPYALAALVHPYALKGKNDAMLPVLKAEVRHVLSRQGANLSEAEREDLAKDIDLYLDVLGSKARLEDFVNLFLAETFLNRFKGE